MHAQIKDAIFLFADKQSFNLTFLKKNLNLSDLDHESLTDFLINSKLIQKTDEREWGREHWYELSSLGREVFSVIKTFQALDTVLSYFVQHTNAHLMEDVCKRVGIPFRNELANMLVNSQVIVPRGLPVKEGILYQITEQGKQHYNSGGFTGAYDKAIQEEFTSLSDRPVPLEREAKSKYLHDDMILYLKEQYDLYPGQWVDLLAYYTDQKESYVREVARELEKEKNWISVLPSGPLGVYFYTKSTGQKTGGVPFPSSLKAKITYDGIKAADLLLKPVNQEPRNVFHGPVNMTQGPNSPITSKVLDGNAVDSSDTRVSVEQTKDEKKESTWKKWAVGTTIIAGLIVAIYKLLDALGYVS